ncbi:NADH:ubiquinone oxidoreductase, NADH-binding subunit (chain F) [Desulfacinum hydrothermale DSM 13146]|uniref:NADH:ubiquinone oxidoreductase, NADH-binding subunit (Chain F) n=1 Tax=Desulfacinum hydrothermale DSM 13146 TaxID=1121390 RepID=A0A1W1X214_9BACT|nr:NADH-ubiquinone oxidoreductase-F iron-sulfur binding region domain-containing protein [Desulfacinum hydrothermale]SMC17778.1 NADH:ubiquinone oxidoreductase, NADH-binding subunit (chain F) [Desulfacinum hydrothermale DSM 13146]
MEDVRPLNPSVHPDPDWFLQRVRQGLACRGHVRDTRIPESLAGLAGVVSVLRAVVDEVRVLLGEDGEKTQGFVQSVRERKEDPWGRDPEGHWADFLTCALARTDWRERDVVEMAVSYLHSIRDRLSPALVHSLADYEALSRGRGGERDRVMAGLIGESRGCLGGLLYAYGKLEESAAAQPFHASQLARLCRLMAWMLGCGETMGPGPETLNEADDEDLWRWMQKLLDAAWAERGLPFPIKDLEKASLYLLERFPASSPHHGHFVRYLLEEDAAYRRILRTFYAPGEVRRQAFRDEVARFNRLPEHAAHRVVYDPEEEEPLVRALFFRPDVVDCFVARERAKELYRALPGLEPRAYLPRVLHETQSLFGYVTPEACERITQCLRLDMDDVIRAVASFKQYGADPSGDILIYVCKGTACFLRGQPRLSRRLGREIGAGREQIGSHGIQYVEMDCFGVCHLAPVIRAGGRFYGNQREEDIPALVKRLVTGPDYDNRRVFIQRLLEKLLSEHRSEPVGELTVSRVGMVSKEEARGQLPLSAWREEFRGRALLLDGIGRVFVAAADTEDTSERFLGRLVEEAVCFRYDAPWQQCAYGAVLPDAHGMVRAWVNVPELWEESFLESTVRPMVEVHDGRVILKADSERFVLGERKDHVLLVESEEHYVMVVLEDDAATASVSAPSPREEKGREAGGFPAGQDRVVLDFARKGRPEDMEDYMAAGGYETVFRVLGSGGEEPWPPERIVEEVSAARLRGRGGAGFPTGKKWEAVRRAVCRVDESDGNKDCVKLIVANGDEGDPGAFMDRTLIEEKPHQVLEGMILAAIAVGARYGVIYVRKEYEDAVRSLENALFQARRKGLLGRNVLGVPGLDFDVEIRLGAGAFVAGEKRAIMRAIEGKPAEPTINAPSNTVRGLWGKPTLLNNVETFANIPVILSGGSRWYASLGTARSGGTKIFSVAGIVKRTGLVEVRFGRTLADVIEICGGIQEGKHLAGVQIGGPSGAILSLTGPRAYLLHTPLDFDTFSEAGAMLGSGGLVFIGDDDDVVRLARHFTDWLREESCGQCPACFRGTEALGRALDRILFGVGTADDIHRLWALGDMIQAGSQCGLGTTAANPVTSALRFFPAAFLHYLLANPEMDLRSLFECLEALRLLTRQDVMRGAGRSRQVVGQSFTLRRHLARFLVEELERMDRWRPSWEKRTERFLELLGLSRWEAGEREVSCQWTEAA